MDRALLMALVVALMLVLLGLMFWGWRARKKRQQAVSVPLAAPSDLGEHLGDFAGKYVATTASGDPYDRIAVHGLGFRSNVTVAVYSSGLLLQLPGTPETFIPARHIRSARRETWTIDRVVERDGLHLIEWTLGDRVVDSYVRVNDPTGFETALEPLVAIERHPQ